MSITDAGRLDAALVGLENATAAGSAFLVQKTVVTLNDAQIKALSHPTPVEIIPAPGANKIIVPVLVFAQLIGALSHPYGNIDHDAYMSLATPDGFSFSNLWINEASSVTTFLDTVLTGGASDSAGAISSAGNNQFPLQGWGIIPEAIGTGAYADKAMQLQLNNGVLADLTGGDASNSLKITVWYVVVDL